MALPPPIRVSRLPPIAFPNRLWADEATGVGARVMPHIRGLDWPEVALEHVMHLQRLCTESIDNVAFLAQSGAIARLVALARLARPNELLVRELLWLLLTCATRDAECRAMMQQWSCVMVLADVLYNHYQTEVVLLELARLIWLLSGQYEAVAKSFLSLGVPTVLGHCLSLGYGQATKEAVQLALETLPPVSGPLPGNMGQQEMFALDIALGDAHSVGALLAQLQDPTLDEATAVAGLWCLCQASGYHASVLWFMLEDAATATKLMEVFRRWGRSPYCLQCIARFLQSVSMDSSISRILGWAGAVEFLLQACQAQLVKPALTLDALAALLHAVPSNQTAFHELGGLSLAFTGLERLPSREHLEAVLHWLPVLRRALADAPALELEFLERRGLPRVAMWMDEMAWHSQLQLECAALLAELSERKANRPYFLVPPVLQAISAALQNVGTQSAVNVPLSRCVLQLMTAAPPEWQDTLQEVYGLGVETGALHDAASSVQEPRLPICADVECCGREKKARPKSAMDSVPRLAPAKPPRPYSATADFERFLPHRNHQAEVSSAPVRGPYYFPPNPALANQFQDWADPQRPMDLIAAPPKKEPAPPPPVKLPTLFGPEVDSLDLGCKANALRAASLSARGPSSRTSERGGSRPSSRPASAFMKQKPEKYDALPYVPRAPEADEATVARLTHDLLGTDELQPQAPAPPPRPASAMAVETVETQLLESSGLFVLREAGLQVDGAVLHQVTVIDAVCAATVGTRPIFSPEVDAPRFQAAMAEQLTAILRTPIPAFRVAVTAIQPYDGLQTAVEWQCGGLTVDQQRHAASALADLTVDFFAAGLCRESRHNWPLPLPPPPGPPAGSAWPSRPTSAVPSLAGLPRGRPPPLEALEWPFAAGSAGPGDRMEMEEAEDDGDEIDDVDDEESDEGEGEGQPAVASRMSTPPRPKSATGVRNKYAMAVVGNERRALTNGQLSVVVRTVSPQRSPTTSPQSVQPPAPVAQIPSTTTSPARRQNFSIPTFVQVTRPIAEGPGSQHTPYGSSRSLLEPGMPLNKPPTATPLPIRPSTCRPSDGSRRLSVGSHGAAMP
eukprot:EG_transcript_1466